MTPHDELGILGLGRMGGGLAQQAAEAGMRVVGVTRSDVDPQLVEAGVEAASSPADFRERLAPPRVVFVYVPAGAAVDTVIDDLTDALDAGDVIVDGGNSYWGDSIRRGERVAEHGIHFVDCGTSGGVEGARHGACFMVGGADDAVARVEPLLKKLAVEGGFVHAGPSGAGHFVKLVHNGIEFGMLQAIAEGVDLLESHHVDLPIADVLRCWRHGSVIRSWLIDLMEAQYREQGGLDDVPIHIEDTGEVNWLIADALHMERPTPVIAQAVMQLFASRDRNGHWARAIAAMRHGFGGHPFGADGSVRRERREGRVGEIWRGPGPAPDRSDR